MSGVSAILLAKQVDSGSMAYVLSTPTSRGKIAGTQIFFSVVSTCLIFVVNSIVHIAVNRAFPIDIAVATGDSVMVTGKLTTKMILLTNLSACAASLAISGLCFLFSLNMQLVFPALWLVFASLQE